MIDFDHGVDPMWQARALRHMCTWCLTLEDPQQKFDEWIDEAGQGDDAYLSWAFRTWAKVSVLTSTSLEQLAYQTNLWQAHTNFGSSAQRAP